MVLEKKNSTFLLNNIYYQNITVKWNYIKLEKKTDRKETINKNNTKQNTKISKLLLGRRIRIEITQNKQEISHTFQQNTSQKYESLPFLFCFPYYLPHFPLTIKCTITGEKKVEQGKMRKGK